MVTLHGEIFVHNNWKQYEGYKEKLLGSSLFQNLKEHTDPLFKELSI